MLLGAVGGPKWDGGAVRPEQGLIGLRKELDVYANLRPAIGDGRRPADRARAGRRALLRRARRRARTARSSTPASTTRTRSRAIARRAFELARGRSGRLLSVDKANVLDTSRMWRRVVDRARRRTTPTSSCATGSSTASRCSSSCIPGAFDVLVMENTFGDILSDVAAGVDRRARARGVGEPRRRRPGDLRAGARLGARHRRHRRREPDARCCARSRCCSSTGSASASWRARVEAAVDAALESAPTPRSRRRGDDQRVRRRRPRARSRWRSR